MPEVAAAVPDTDPRSTSSRTSVGEDSRRMREQERLGAVEDLRERNRLLEKRVDQLQGELGEAKKSVQYMNKVMMALKAHKTATAAAKAAMEELRTQLANRDQQVSELQAEKLKMQEAYQDLKIELEDSDMATMQAIASAEESRKQAVVGMKQLEEQHVADLKQVAQRKTAIAEECHQELSQATKRESQCLVTIMVMRAVDQVKTNESHQLRSVISNLKAEVARVAEADARKDQVIEGLTACITDRDSQIETLLQCQASDNSEKQKLRDVTQQLELEKQELHNALLAAEHSRQKLESVKHELIEHHQTAMITLEKDNAELRDRVSNLMRSHDDLHATIKSRTSEVEDQDRVLTELRTDLLGMSGAMSIVDQELKTYQLQERRTNLETVLEDLNVSGGTEIDLQGAVVTCSAHHVPLDNKLEITATGAVLKNGILRVPLGHTIHVQSAASIQLQDITLEMVDATRTSAIDQDDIAPVDSSRCPLLRIQPGAEANVLRCRVSGSCGVGVSVGDSARLTGEDVWLEGCQHVAMEICGGHVDLAGCSCKECGNGVVCTGPAQVAIQNIAAQGIHGQLLAACSGAQVRLREGRLEGGQTLLLAQDGAQLECQGLTITGSHGTAGAHLSGAGTVAKFEACTFQKIECAAVSVLNGAAVSLARCKMVECSSDDNMQDSACLQVHGEGSKASVNSSSFSWNSHHCIGCFNGACVDIVGSQLTHNDTCCLLASGASATVSLADTCILDSMGTAVSAQHEAVIEATDVRLSRCTTGAEAKSLASITFLKGCIDGCSLQACISSQGAALCLSQVQIASTAGRGIHASGAGTHVRCEDCKLLRSAGPQALCDLGAKMTLDDVQIAEGSAEGIVIAGPDSSVTVSACHILKQQGAALCVKAAYLTFANGTIGTCGSVGSIEDRGSVQLQHTVVSECREGLQGVRGAQITVASTVFTHISGTAALCVRDKDTEAHLEGCSIEACSLGGVLAGAGARCQMKACSFKLNGVPSVHSYGQHAVVELSECSFNGNAGPCISVAQGAAATARDCRTKDTEGNAVCVADVGSTGLLERCSLEDTGKHGMIVYAGGNCILQNGSISGSHVGAGLVAVGEGSSITCSGTHVTAMQLAACVVKHGASVNCDAVNMHGTTCGSGAIVAQGGRLVAHACSIEDNSDHGVLVAEGGCAELHACGLFRNRMGCGVFVADTGSHMDARECKVQENGRCGVLVAGGGSLACSLCEIIEHMHGAGVIVQGKGSHASVQESTVVGCGAAGLTAFNSGCADCKRVNISFAGDHGVEARDCGTVIDLQECSVDNCTGCGVLAMYSAQVNLQQRCVVKGKGHEFS
eukprot:jgi/Ulvmu1/7924/UM004_0156.1